MLTVKKKKRKKKSLGNQFVVPLKKKKKRAEGDIEKLENICLQVQMDFPFFFLKRNRPVNVRQCGT